MADARRLCSKSFVNGTDISDPVVARQVDEFMNAYMKSIPIDLLDGWDDDERWVPLKENSFYVKKIRVDEPDDTTDEAQNLPPHKATAFVVVDDSTIEESYVTDFPPGTDLVPDGHAKLEVVTPTGFEYHEVPYFWDQDEAEEMVQAVWRAADEKAVRWSYQHALYVDAAVTLKHLNQAGFVVAEYKHRYGNGTSILAGIDGAGYSFLVEHYYKLFVLHRYNDGKHPLVTETSLGPVIIEP